MGPRLEGKVAIVTGAAMGIGQATRVLMAREGARVVVADLNLEAARATVDRDRARPAAPRSRCTSTRWTKARSRRWSVARGRPTARLHVLHNNVGGTDTSRDNSVVEMDWSYWNTAITLNLGSTVYACRCAIPLMIASGGGSIVNTSSMVALSGDVRPTAYAAAKGGVISFTRFVATQYGKQGIRCNAIAPGLILTPRATPRPQAVLDIFERHTLVPQHGRPEDIAYTALFLASDESRFITGQTIEVDGGAHVHNPTTPDLVAMSLKPKGTAT